MFSKLKSVFNITHLEHSIIAVGIQLILWPFLGLLSAGVVACAVFLGREVSQHEYKLIQELGGRHKLNWYSGLIHKWAVDSVLDVVMPALACLVVYTAASLLI